MPLFYFVLKRGLDRVPEPEGLELPNEEAARTHAISVARDLMRHRSVATSSWRLEVSDDYLIPRFEILFAEVDNTNDHLLPEYRETIESVSRSTASLHDAISRVYSSIDQVRETLARVDSLITTVSVPSAQLHQSTSP